jgi:hypothetical protein
MFGERDEGVTCDDLMGLTPAQIAEKSDELWRLDSVRRDRYASLARRYFQDVYYQGQSAYALAAEIEGTPTLAIGRSHVDTAVSKIAGVTDTKVQFMTTRSNWRQRLAVDEMEQFCIGVFNSNCEGYANIWDLRRLTMRDACIFGTGAERIYFDPRLGRATFGRVFPWEILFDYHDGEDGNPSALFHRFPMDRGALKRSLPKKKLEISRASHPMISDKVFIPGGDESFSYRSENQVLVTEYWERGTKDEPGRHLLITKEGDVLFEEDWIHDWFPFNTFHWCAPLSGMWGSSLLEQSRKIENWINYVITKIKKATDIQSVNTTVYQEGSIAECSKAFTETVGALCYKKNTPQPTVYTPQAFNPQLFEMVQNFKTMSFELVGVSQMSATAKTQTGIEANSAMLTLADLQSERFSVEHKSFHQGFVELARKSMLITRDSLKGGKKASISVPGDGFINQVDWPELDIDEEMFYVQIQQAPTSKWTVASRIQTAETLGQAGILKPENVARVQRYADVDSELDISSRQDQYFSTLVGRWLKSTEKQREANRLRPGDEKSPLLVPVFESVLDPVRGVGVIGDSFIHAILDEVDPEVLDLFRNYLDLMDQVLSAQTPMDQAKTPQPPDAATPVQEMQ